MKQPLQSMKERPEAVMVLIALAGRPVIPQQLGVATESVLAMRVVGLAVGMTTTSVPGCRRSKERHDDHDHGRNSVLAS